MYKHIIQPLLFAINNERAHTLVVMVLRVVGMIPGGRWLLRMLWDYRHPSLEREVFGVTFSNPVGMAAGFDRNGEIIGELSSMGFGFVEVGTVTPRPQIGNPRPRLFRLVHDNAIVNRVGLANKGLEYSLKQIRKEHKGIVVGCNIGKNAATPPEKAIHDYLKTYRSLYQYADYFTVNIHCDNGCRELATHTKEGILAILNPLFDFRRGQNQYRPIMLKISPDMSDEALEMVEQILIDTPLDGIVAATGTNSREGLETSSATLDKLGGGRLSGAPLTKRSLEMVRHIHEATGGQYPIIGVGGLMSVEDVEAMLEAGADLVQIYSGYIYNGPSFVKQINKALVEKIQHSESQKE